MRTTIQRRGFTLTETLVVIAITAIVMTSIGYTLQFFYQKEDYIVQETQATQAARTSVQNVVSDLREASYGADGSYPIANAGTSTLTFYANVDTDASVEKATYYLSGTTFYQSVVQPAGSPQTYTGNGIVDVVVNNVRNGTSTPIFYYYDSSGNVLSYPINVSQIASIKVTVMTDVNPNRAPLVYTLTGSATLRNLRNQSTQ